ncbi:unnamed protein product [Ilex paraguariensis]|uniref:MSP domain-containing protein n=1 Tax=Ilex paraguariensis TaxID=185542 RepID=A0ABC8RS76_9AQUA
MSAKLVEIEPRELKFTFEVKKQSSCAVHLANISDQYVAFKVKTTSPKKYCVRPNIGIIKPKSTCDFTVTMQAQRSAPSEMQCKDKFLIQSTVVSFGTTEEDITPGMFAKDSGMYIEENKLKVVLISPPHSPVLLPVNGVSKQEGSYDTSIQKEKMLSGIENLPPTHKLSKDVEDPPKVVEDMELSPSNDVINSPTKYVEPRLVKDLEGTKLKSLKDIEELKSKMNTLDSELIEAESTIIKLKEERSTTIQEKERLKQELAVLRRKNGVRRVQVGFPALFVCMVALTSLAIGYLLRV